MNEETHSDIPVVVVIGRMSGHDRAVAATTATAAAILCASATATLLCTGTGTISATSAVLEGDVD
ncbi:MAG: hypothetical protein HQK98_02365 [Nitrospirae bacterium]|nr:hypothetical protein [Nitrospirota bacterium]